MGRNHQFAAALVATLATAPTAALAWGHAGHQVVGDIADHLLAGHTAANEVKKLLGVKLAEAAKWADCAKQVNRSNAKGVFYQADSKDRYACTAFNSPADHDEIVAYNRPNYTTCVYAKGRKPCASTFHFADIDFREGKYDDNYYGANERDIVHVLQQAIAILRSKDAKPNVPGPINFDPSLNRKRIALFVIAHMVGDLHQPLHVGAVYLTPSGQLKTKPDEASTTAGGNSITFGETTQVLHGLWDTIPPCWKVGSGCAKRPNFAADSKPIPKTNGEATNWPEKWASETVGKAKDAFDPLTFSAGDEVGTWKADESGEAGSYAKARRDLQLTQIELAGARLAQLLMAIWPDHR